MSPSSALGPLAAQTALFDLWAETYDDESNPLLLLEERALKPLLPALTGAHVVDAGCGTGRWLRRLEAHGAASLLGVDPSSAMLEQASRGCSSRTRLVQGVCTCLPVQDAACTLLLSSFVLGYVGDIGCFARECARVLTPDGHVLLADMHPDTAAERNWTRGFKRAGSQVNLSATRHTLTEIRIAFERVGFALSVLEEPSFGLPEHHAFALAGKSVEFEGLLTVPAIYVMKLRKRSRLQIIGAPWSTGPHTWSQEPFTIENGDIVTPQRDTGIETRTLNLEGYTLLPGLINAHDHLEFALFPNLGRSADQPSYCNATEWASEIHEVHAEVISMHLRVPLRTRLWWGALRNLLCGVTTVCHHNHLHMELTAPDYPVHVLGDFGWAHSLRFDNQLVERYRETPHDRPFIIHAGEGTDETSRAELSQLDQLHILTGRTVLVHGLAFTHPEIASINERSTAIILCPTSNRFLFGQTLSAEVISTIRRVAIGSDSPLTAAGDLLDEINLLIEEHSLAPCILYEMVTTGAADILQLQRGAGRLSLDCPADVIAVRDRKRSPADTFAELKSCDIELVMRAGTIQIISPLLYERLPADLRSGLQLLAVAGDMRWVRAPLTDLFLNAEEHLGKGALRLGGKEVHLVSAH